jgi:hypothetical protein
LRAKADALRRRLLPRFYSNRLRKQIDGHRFMSGPKLAITAQTIHILHDNLLVPLVAADSGV